MPNSLAYVMLTLWPLVATGLFRLMSLERALVWSILGAYLLLPPIAAFDLPMIPPLDKKSIPNLSAFLICVLILGKRVPILPASPVARMLTLLFILSPIATTFTNADPIVFAGGGLPGLRSHDAISAVAGQFIALLPFFLGRRFLASPAAQREVLWALLLAGLAYSLPMLVEIRLSPQLNLWIYGFFQHNFDQMMRFGGFRPIVFLEHGLWVAFLVMTTLLAAISLWRAAEPAKRAPYLLATGYLGVILVLCKSVAALAYGFALAPLVAVAGKRTQLRIAALLALVAVLYPLIRGADLVPVDAMVAQAELVNEERAGSLRFRFDNEGVLLDHANERPWFGWGPWGRHRLYEQDTGKDIAVTDGRWIIVIGIFGWSGYIAEFGLLGLPLLLLARRTAQVPVAQISPFAGALALILAINMIDMLPNATLTPFTWLLAGAMLGHAEALAARRSPAEAPAQSTPTRDVLSPAARPRTIL